MDIAKRVKTIRERKGISVYKLAKTSGISSTYLYEVEMGKTAYSRNHFPHL